MSAREYDHPAFKLWVCEVDGCGSEYQMPAVDKPHRWQGRIVCAAHAGAPAVAFVAPPELDHVPIVDTAAL